MTKLCGQAIRLNYFPHMKLVYTSDEQCRPSVHALVTSNTARTPLSV
jgi:hypothetical protein